ncbi:MAG: sulfite exporter TauE/SafE family protein [Chloroflexi bacterium]|nr:sulfite exporter TauE/SafE family protein [Chloroflexota bacterium]
MIAFVGALLIGAAVGVLTGLFGVGGGFLITPLLNILLGVPMPVAVGTGALQILGVSTSGLVRRRHERLTDFKIAIVLLGGNLIGVRLGADTLSWLGQLGTLSFGGERVPTVEFVLLCIFFVLLSAIAVWLWYDTSRPNASPVRRVGLFARIKIPPYTEFPSLEEPRLSLVAMSYFGLALGFLTGLLGIGGGVLMVPALVYLVGLRTHKAAATSLAIIWLSSLIATITHAARGNADLLLAIPLLLGGTAGLQLGVNLCNRLAGPQLRRYFSLVVLTASLIVIGKILVIVL